MRTFWVITFSAFLIRIIAAITFDSWEQAQTFEYDAVARSILSGEGFRFFHTQRGIYYYTWVEPVYPMICALVYYLTGMSLGWLLIVQMAVNSLHAGLMYRIGAILLDRRAGTLCGVLFALHPGYVIFSSQKAHPLIFDAFFFTLVFWQFYHLRIEGTRVRAVVTGLITGIAVLNRTTGIFFLPIGILSLFWQTSKDTWSRSLKNSGWVIFCAFIVIFPWVLRNHPIQKDFVPLRSNWQVFWLGNNPNATGHGYTSRGTPVLDSLTREQMSEVSHFKTSLQWESWYREQALAYISEDPLRFVAMSVKKFYYFWWFSPQVGTLYPHYWRGVYKIFYAVILVLAVYGGFHGYRYGDPDLRNATLTSFLFILSVSLIQSLHYVEGRHRWSVESFLLLFAAMGATILWDTFKRRYLGLSR